MVYFSDGSAAQYKNRKNVLNITCHNEDFGVPAEWHSFATSYGKLACDGVGGTLKRLVAKPSLQRPYSDQIMIPHQLHEWAQSSIHNLSLLSLSKLLSSSHIWCFICKTLVGFLHYSLCLITPHMAKSQGIRSGDLGGHSTFP
jgi:hypothetical protein